MRALFSLLFINNLFATATTQPKKVSFGYIETKKYLVGKELGPNLPESQKPTPGRGILKDPRKDQRKIVDLKQAAQQIFKKMETTAPIKETSSKKTAEPAKETEASIAPDKSTTVHSKAQTSVQLTTKPTFHQTTTTRHQTNNPTNHQSTQSHISKPHKHTSEIGTQHSRNTADSGIQHSSSTTETGTQHSPTIKNASTQHSFKTRDKGIQANLQPISKKDLDSTSKTDREPASKIKQESVSQPWQVQIPESEPELILPKNISKLSEGEAFRIINHLNRNNLRENEHQYLEDYKNKLEKLYNEQPAPDPVPVYTAETF